MTSEDHLSMHITRSYLESLHEECDSPNFKAYLLLMAHKAVVVAEREKKTAADFRACGPVAGTITR